MKSNPVNVVRQFKIDSPVSSIEPLGEGFINDTFLVKTTGGEDSYLLQRKNSRVFHDIPGMMRNIDLILQHMKSKIVEQGQDPLREAMTIMETEGGGAYIVDESGEYWTLTLFIPDHLVFESVDSPELAYEGGKGIGRFQLLLSDLTETLVETIPGFHNIKSRFQQWDDVLKRDPVGRKAGLKEEISWIEERRETMLKFHELSENGTIPRRVAHNDAKISNILFTSDREALCMIDLDTVMRSPAMNDFGDAIRSMANTGLEDDPDPANVGLNLDHFEAFTKGYLSETSSFLTRQELEALAYSPLYITYEQVLRFLMDYLEGDRYYKIRYDDHNLVRSRAQYALLASMEKNLSRMNEILVRMG